MAHRRGHHISRTVTLLSSLLRGEQLDVKGVMQMLGLKKAGARRHLDVLERLAGVARVPGRRARTLMLKLGLLEPQPALTTAFAACVGAGFGTLFAGAPKFQAAFAEVRDTVLHRARRKSTFKNLERKFLFLAGGGEIGFKDHPTWLDDVVTALVEEQRLSIDYEHMDGRAVSVRIEPLSLVVHQHQLYVIGRNLQKPGEVWPYRFAGISDLRITEETFSYPPASQYSPEQTFGQSFGVFISEQYPVEEIKVRLTGAMAKYANRHRWHHSQRMIMDDSAAILTFTVRACPELVSWVLSMGPDAEVLSPESLRDRIAGAARATAELYGTTLG